MSAITFDDSGKGAPQEIVHQLRKQGFSGIHSGGSGNTIPEAGQISKVDSSRHHRKKSELLLSFIWLRGMTRKLTGH
jgi:hypothetical protein